MFPSEKTPPPSSPPKQQPVRTRDRPHCCDVCKKTFPQSNYLKQHKLTHSGEKPHKCDQCDKRFGLSSTLRRHKLIHTGERPYTCDLCDRDFTQSHILKEHLRVQHNVFSCKYCKKSLGHLSENYQCPHSKDQHPISCQYCGKTFSRNFDLKRHIRCHTGERPYSCEQCGKRFTLSSTLIQHKRVHTGERPYKCDKCEKTFTQAGHMKLHTCRNERDSCTCKLCKKTFKKFEFKYHECSHCKDKLVVPSTCQFCGKSCSRANDSTKANTGERANSCEECWKRFTLSTTLLGHKDVQAVLRFKCDQCGRTFSKSHHLKYHLRNFHKENRPFVCPFCKKTFTQSSALEYHKCSRGKNRPYSCDECKKSFTRPYVLKMHRRSHTGANLSKCVRCKMTFTTALSLMMHRRRCGKGSAQKTLLQPRRQLMSQSTTKSSKTYTGAPALKTEQIIHNNNNNWPYKCDHCEKSFIRAHHLKIHIRAHTGKKLFKCGNCGMKFAKTFNLQRHIQTFHSPDANTYKCDVCGTKFTRESSLKIHRGNHKKGKPYGCGCCEASFDLYQELKEHLRSHPEHKSVQCERCGSRFSKANNLKRHMQIHFGQPTHPCDQCGKVFDDPSTLRTHHLVHSGPYACEKCERSFITAEKLRQHKITHFEEAIESYKVQSVDHVQESDNVRAVEMDSFQVEVELEMSCEVCSKTFNTKDRYYEHLRKHEIQLIVI